MLLSARIAKNPFEEWANKPIGVGGDPEGARVMLEFAQGVTHALRLGPLIEVSYADERYREDEYAQLERMFTRFEHDHERGIISPTKVMTFLSDEYPNVAPPFPVYWMEYFGRINEDTGELGHTGCAFISLNLVESEDPFIRELFGDHPEDLSQEALGQVAALTQEAQRAMGDRAPEGARWAIMAIPVIHRRVDRITPPPLWTFCYFVDGNGKMLSEGLINFASERVRSMMQEAFSQNHLLLDTMCPFWEALQILHCKNASLRERDFPSPKQRKAFVANLRRGAPTKYYTLQVKDPRTKKEIELLSKREKKHLAREEASERALHLVRAHYVRYTEERPLFGRVVGTFFKPAHFRGNREMGVIQKNYKVRGGDA